MAVKDEQKKIEKEGEDGDLKKQKRNRNQKWA